MATSAEMSGRQHGGPRTPVSPKPVSGPGRLSARTDGAPSQKDYQLPNAGYGEQAQYQQDQRGAPLAATPGPGSATMPQARATKRQPPVPLSAPTQRPDEPVTAGAALGPGPGPEALGTTPDQASYQAGLQSLQAVAAGPGGSQAAALLSMLQTRN